MTPSFEAIRRRAEVARARGRSIVVVQGLGFVGSAMAAVTAASVDDRGEPRFFVIGVDLDSGPGPERIAALNAGRPAVQASDPELAELTATAATDLRSLCATPDVDVYGLADVVVVDLPLDVEDAGERIDADLTSFRAALRVVARRVRPECLVLVETTVPPGTTEQVLEPLFREEFRARAIEAEPLLAHAYERVMPGPRYVESIRSFWRVFAGCSEEASERARAFLSEVVDVERFPLTRLSSPTASEVAKVLENSYRATNIAFIDEWSQAAEQVGVDLFEVVDAIRMRKGTHDNIRQPGFGVGGYCLPKDGHLAEWGFENLLGARGGLPMTRRALEVNRRMPLHTLELVRDELGAGLTDATVGLAGISYLSGVGDTRNSPAETFAHAAREAGARVIASDPLVSEWPECPAVPLVPIAELLRASDAVVFTLDHEDYRGLAAEDFGAPKVVIDACGVFRRPLAETLTESGFSVRGVGRGAWSTQRSGR